MIVLRCRERIFGGSLWMQITRKYASGVETTLDKFVFSIILIILVIFLGQIGWINVWFLALF